MTAEPLPSLSRIDQIEALRERMQRMSGGVPRRAVGTPPELSGLVQLYAGGAYAVDTVGLATALLAGPSAAGGWCAVVGVDDLGAEAARAAGVHLDRTVLVPDPGAAWVEVTAALVDVVTAVLVRPPVTVSESTAAKLGARLRKRGAVLLALTDRGSDWPRAEVRLTTHEPRWSGLGDGHGYLAGREVDVVARRGAAPPRRTTLRLPAGDLPPLTRGVPPLALVEAG